MSDLIPYHIILSAKAGDGKSLQTILRHYASYIAFFSKRSFYDEFGNCYELIDEDIRQRIEAKLMYQIITKFDPYQSPTQHR